MKKQSQDQHQLHRCFLTVDHFQTGSLIPLLSSIISIRYSSLKIHLYSYKILEKQFEKLFREYNN